MLDWNFQVGPSHLNRSYCYRGRINLSVELYLVCLSKCKNQPLSQIIPDCWHCTLLHTGMLISLKHTFTYLMPSHSNHQISHLAVTPAFNSVHTLSVYCMLIVSAGTDWIDDNWLECLYLCCSFTNQRHSKCVEVVCLGDAGYSPASWSSQVNGTSESSPCRPRKLAPVDALCVLWSQSTVRPVLAGQVPDSRSPSRKEYSDQLNMLDIICQREWAEESQSA